MIIWRFSKGIKTSENDIIHLFDTLRPNKEK